MRRTLCLAIAAAVALSLAFAERCRATPCVRESGTTYVMDALAPYVESGEFPGAVSILYDDGVQETACIGYADVEAARDAGRLTRG